MQINFKLLKRKAAGMTAVAMILSVIPVNLTGYAGINAADYFSETLRATPSDAAAATPSSALKAEGEGTTYYIDAVNGQDDADGTSEEAAWKTFDRVNLKTFLPGDRILLKADCVWNQALNPRGSGRDGEPITIDMYGEGSRPVINGNGTKGAAITGAVTIYNEEYWEIYNLEVTNMEDTDAAGEQMDGGTAERAGILIYSSNQEKIYKHIVVKNCYVHDVNSSLGGMKTSGGIIVLGHYMDRDGNIVTIDDNGNLTAKAMGRAAYEDVLIEGNYVKNVAVEGIRNKCNTNIGSGGWGKNEFLKNFSDVTIRNNYLQDVVGDGIVLTETIGGLVEGNMVNSSCGMDRGNVNYAQCWTMYSDDIYIQYNEAYGNKYGYDDGEAFDSDMMNVNNVFQYNLSHDCGGGAMLFMSNQRNTTFRYNVSINDGFGTYPKGSRLHQQTFHYDNTSSAGDNVGKIYNNTIVVFGEGNQTALFGGSARKTCYIDFRNNIVLAEDGAKITFGVVEKENHKSTIHKDSVIENNCFWPASIPNTESGEILTIENLKAKGNIFADPKLADYRAGESYSEYVYPLEDLAELSDSDFTRDRIRELVEPYQLTEESPCIRAGQRLNDTPAVDIMGNIVAGRVDMGAIEYSSEEETAETVESVEFVTTLGIMPVLPKTLTVTLEGETSQYPVEWEDMNQEDFTTAGVVIVHGRLPGLTNDGNAVIVVADKPESYGPVEVETYAGIYPKLPDKVTAVFAGGMTMSLDVIWDKLPLEVYDREGTVHIAGKVSGLKETCTAIVTVIGKLGDGTTIKESTVMKDAYIQESDADQAYGASDPQVIKVKTANNAPSYTRRGIIGFDVTDNAAMLESVAGVTIKMQMTRPVSADDYKNIHKQMYLNIYETDNNWEETSVTWNNAADGDPGKLVVENKKIVYTDIRVHHDNIVELDVTDYVKRAYAKDGQTKFSFLMVTDYFGEYADGDNGGIDFASKEADGKMAPTMVLSNVYEKSIEAVTVSTPAGKAPKLPETVRVRYSNDTEKEVSVEWKPINPANYQAEGTFQVYGTSDGVNLPIACIVTVMEAMHKVVTVKNIPPIIRLVGTPWEEAGLPETAIAVLDNGQEAELAIQYWFPDHAYDAAKEFSYTCIGYLDLTNHQSIENPNRRFATVNLSVIEPEDKHALLILYMEAADIVNGGGTENLTQKAKERFLKAFNKASEVLVDPEATESEVHFAYTSLMAAIWYLEEEESLKADTGALRDQVLIAESKHKKDNTEESYELMREILKKAKEILKDKTLTKNDQAMVDDICEALREAVNSLELNGNPGKPAKVMTGIRITSLPGRTEYLTGEKFSRLGLLVSAVYDDDSTKAVTGFDVSDVNTSIPGTKDVVVTYRVAVNDAIRMFTDTFQITVHSRNSSGGSSGGSSNGGGSGTGNVSGKWETSGNGWRYKKESGTYASNEWAKIKDKWYRFRSDGTMQRGWITEGGIWYKLKDDGAMATGWNKDITDGFWYYFNSAGAMRTGWVQVEGTWYYFTPVTQGSTGWSAGEEGTLNYGTAVAGSRPMGSLYTDAITPDGYKVDENGAWIP